MNGRRHCVVCRFVLYPKIDYSFVTNRNFFEFVLTFVPLYIV